MTKLKSLKIQAHSLLLAVYLITSTPKPAQAEESLAYKYEDYQEDNNRIRVEAHYVRAEKDLGANTELSLVGLVDTITGSTPTGVPLQEDDPNQVPLEELEDRRESAIVTLEHKQGDHIFTFEASYSDESDYRSKGGSILYKREFNKNNTTFQTGYSVLDDKLFAPTLRDPDFKNSNDYFVGITQIVNPSTVVRTNLSYGKENGLLADPYKVVQKTVEILPDFFLPITFPENRPRTRDKWILFTEVQRDFQKLNGSLQASVRYFSDDADIDAHTWTFEWYQRLSEQVILRPMYRYHRQSAANFYYYNLDDTDIIPDRTAIGSAPYFASDHRLSKMETHTWGAKLIWFITDELEFDIKYSRFEMNGLDGITHFSAYSDADILTVGGRWWF